MKKARKMVARTVCATWAAMFCTGAFAACQETFEFAKRRDAFRLVGAVYTNRAEAASQVTVEADGLHARFDSDKLPVRPDWSTFTFGSSYGAAQDWYGHRLRLVFRRRPFSRSTRGMALNFMDPDGETFQFIAHHVEEDTAVNELLFDFTVDPHRVSGSPWGGGAKANGKMDRPVRLTGLHTHFGGVDGPGEVVLVRLEDVPPRAPDALARTIRSTEPISTDGTYPGAEPFHGPEALEFRIEPATYCGPITLTLSSGSTASVSSGRMTKFTAVATNGVVRFACGLPFENLYQFYRLVNAEGRSLKICEAKGLFRQSAAEALRLEVETGNRFGVCRTERAHERPVVLLRNPSGERLHWKTNLVFTDVLDHRFTIPFDRDVLPGETVRVAVPWPLPAKGMWYVRAELKDPDGGRVRHDARFAWIECNERTPYVAKPKFRMGIHWHSTYYLPDLVDPVIEAMVMAGAKFTRMDYGCMFSDVARADGTYDWSKTDDMVGRVRAAGLATDCIIWGAPGWAVDPALRAARTKYPRSGCTPTRPGLFRDFCRAMGARYGTKIDYYEIGNEWDLAPALRLSPSEALALQREAYEGLHAGCADVCVTPNGWASLSARSTEEPARGNPGIVQFFAAHPDCYDAWVFHNHSAFPSFERAVQTTYFPLCTNEVFAAKPWVCNEAALTNHGNGEPEVARTVWAKILYAWNWGSRDYIWYNLRATGWLEGGEPGYGLMTAGLKPRASYAAYAALAKIFQGLDADGRLLSDRGLQLLRFKGAKGTFSGLVLAGWNWGTETPRIVQVKTDARRAELSDHFGNRTAVEIRNGVVDMPLNADPRALLLDGATFARLAN